MAPVEASGQGQEGKDHSIQGHLPPPWATAMKPLTNAHAGAQPCTEQPSVGLEPTDPSPSLVTVSHRPSPHPQNQSQVRLE